MGPIQLISLLLALSAACIGGGTLAAKPALASPRGQMYVPFSESGGAILPDWNQITFQDFPSVARDGQLDLSTLAGALGYDPSRFWQSGDGITSVLMLGDLADATNLPTRSLESILSAAGLPAGSLSLADFGVVEKQTFQSLVDAVPNLANLSLLDVQPLYDLVQQELGTAISFGDLTLGELANQNVFASLPLNSLNLSEYGLDSLPGLTNAPLNQFARWGETLIDKIPGLANLPFANFFTDLGKSGPFALVDIVFGDDEAERTNTVTGSTNVGFDYLCNQSNCAHIELANPGWVGGFLVHGKQWISGNSQRVSGGSGCLTGIEPTGRHPFGQGFKVVLADTDEANGRAEFNIYFRFKVWCGKSPYIIGPFPWMSQYEKDLIFLGID